MGIKPLQLSLIFLLMGYCLVKNTHGCSCFTTHPQQSLCMAEYVIEAKIIKKEQIIYETKNLPKFTTPAFDKYTLDTKKVYRSNKTYDETTDKHLLLYPTSSSCILNLKVGKTYILSGAILNDHLSAPFCGGVKKERSKFKRKEWKMFKAMVANCECEINFCYIRANCEKKKHQCTFITGKPSNDCLIDHSYCMKTRKGCAWSKSSKFSNCVRKF